MEKYLTTDDAAEYLGVTPSRIRQLIGEGRLSSVKHGRDHMLSEADMAAFAARGKKKRGRPRKAD